jgi:1,4-dihydroxy-2-naphthoate polyprenyltransferase
VNNLRDIPTDRAAGKLTTAVRLGDRATRGAYEMIVAIAVMWPVAMVPSFGPRVLIALLVIPLAARTSADLRSRTGTALNASLGATARLQLVQGLLLAGGIAASTLSL